MEVQMQVTKEVHYSDFGAETPNQVSPVLGYTITSKAGKVMTRKTPHVNITRLVGSTLDDERSGGGCVVDAIGGDAGVGAGVQWPHPADDQ